MGEVSGVPHQPISTTKQRFLFIDLYRSAVILLMLEGHVVRTFLSLRLQQTTFFQLHEFFHGLSAPAFLFGAGLTFIISTRQRWIEYHHWGTPLARRMRRLLWVILLGLALHLPFFSIRKIIMNGTTNDYLQLFECDVLACIGIGLLTLHALVFFFKTEGRFYGLVLATTLTVCFLTPLVWDVDFLRTVPIAIAQLMNSSHGSPFPLFPFVGFLFAGVIVSWEFHIAFERKQERNFMRRLLILGAVFIVTGILFDIVPLQIYPTYNYWYTSPNYFFVRIGCLMILTSGCWLLATRIPHTTTILTALGKESLFVYILHLVILYGSAVNPKTNLQVFLGSNFGLVDTMGLCIIFISGMWVCAIAWNYLKNYHFNLYRLTQLGTSALFLYLLFTREN
jgi:hypothetical protein